VTVLGDICQCQGHSALSGLEVVYGNIWNTSVVP
jgi:hypothetical protein